MSREWLLSDQAGYYYAEITTNFYNDYGTVFVSGIYVHTVRRIC